MRGRVVLVEFWTFAQIGEGNYERTESAIRALLDERDEAESREA